MAEFFQLIRVSTHVGVSPTALRTMMREMEERVAEFGPMQEEQQRQKGRAEREIVGSGDETWLGDQLLLVLMDLITGYLVLEAAAEDRSYETCGQGASEIGSVGLGRAPRKAYQ